jgi:methyltransferase-like protein 6
MNSEFTARVLEYKECIAKSIAGDSSSLSSYYNSLPAVPPSPAVEELSWLYSISSARVQGGAEYKVVEEWDEERDDKDANDSSKDSSVLEKGKQFTAEGPAPYTGDILENSELVWADDAWTPEKESMALSRLQEQAKTGKPASEHWRNKYVKEAGRYWHYFYQRNEDHFYKDRHYLHVVFPELLTQPNDVAAPQASPYDRHWYLLEIGSGVGNAIWPLLQINPVLKVSAMDFAKSAIELLNKRALQPENLDASGHPRAQGYIKSIISPDFEAPPPTEMTTGSSCSSSISGSSSSGSSSLGAFPGYNAALCMFVLSAIAPEDHHIAFRNIFHALRHQQQSTGQKSYLMIRDYGRYDEAQLRFKGDAKLDDNFYVRQDGTCAYFFTIDELISLGSAAGFQVEESYYIHRQYANRQKKQARYRVWVHVKFSC